MEVEKKRGRGEGETAKLRGWIQRKLICRGGEQIEELLPTRDNSQV